MAQCGLQRPTSFEQRIRDTALNLGSGGDQLEAVAGVPGTGSLSISIAQYLNLVDWTGRQMHPGKRGKSLPSGHGFLIALA